MRNKLVYDLPTRFFHWLFAGLFLSAFAIAKLMTDDSPWFNYHSIAGLTLGFLVVLRIIWGFFGTRHARFSDFALNPTELFDYFKKIFSSKGKAWAGHNPASSWAAVAMMLMGLGLAITGYLMTSGRPKEDFEDIHELLANGFIIVVIGHVAGIVLHTIRHKELIGLSMIDGKKTSASDAEVIHSTKPAFGFLLIGLVLIFGLEMYRNYNKQTHTLQFFGTELQLTATEKESAGELNTEKDSNEDRD